MSESYATPARTTIAAIDERGSSTLAGRCLRWATGTLAAAAVSIGLFFGGAGYVFGPINDITTAATLLLIVPAVLAVRSRAGSRAGAWLTGLSVATIIGLVVAASGLLLLVAGVVSLNDSFVIGGVGILPFLGWLAALAFLSLRRGVLTRRVGWLTVAALSLSILSTAASPILPMGTLVLVLGLPLLAVFAGLLWFLGRDLDRA